MMTDRIPKPSRHRATGQGVVRLNGTDHYLGRFGSAAAKVEYDALINRWLAHGRSLPDPTTGLTVNDVILAYVKFAEGYYKPGSTMTTGELRCIRDAIRPVKELFGRTHAAEFGPKKLKTVQQRMLARGWCRTHVTLLKSLPKTKEYDYRKAVVGKAPTEFNPGERSDVSVVD
jgi:hypothetical protein